MNRTPRDPEGRKKAIIAAAADLVVELGLHQVTHRKVAERAGVPLGSTTQYFATLDDLLIEAMAELSGSGIETLAQLEKKLDASADVPATLARDLIDYLADETQLKAEAAFHVAHLDSPQLRAGAHRWSEHLIELLSRHTDPVAARAIAHYADGVIMHGATGGVPVVEAEVTEAIRRLMGGTRG